MTSPFSTISRIALCLAVLLGMSPQGWAAYSAAAYQPLPDGAYWEYSDGASDTVVNGTTLINGATTKRVVDNFGDSTFYSNDSRGLRIHRFIWTGYPRETATFRTPVPLMKAQNNVGDQLRSAGKLDYVVQDYGTYVLNYESTVNITGTEVITVPYGTFETLKITLTFRVYGTVDGEYGDETETVRYWQAPGLGTVKVATGAPYFETAKLVDTNLPELIPCIVIGGTSGDDTLEGTPAKDCINGKAGDDTMYGLGDNDVYTVQSAGDVVIEGAGEGTDTIKSSVTYTLPIYVEKLTLTGTANINGTGNGLANTITGNGGNNTLNGAAGNDILRGGAGQDKFVFKTALNNSTNVDKITDFSAADDTIRLENAVFTALPATGPLASAAFATGTAASTAAHRIIYDPTTGAVRYDADGNGPAAAVRFATLTTKPPVTRSDFVVQ